MSIAEITPQELYQKFISGQKPIIIDVRNPIAFGEWNIFTSQNIPYKKIMELNEKKDFPIKNLDSTIITVCSRGNDSKVTGQKLLDLGIETMSLSGGLRAWNDIMNIVRIPTTTDLEIYQFQRIAKGCLSYVIINDDEAIVVDPSYNIESYINFLKERNITLTKVFETHLHADHVAGGKFLAEKLNANLYLPVNDPFQFAFNPINNNDTFKLGNEKITSLYTPGHTKGSTSYRVAKDVLLVGDTIFVDGIGRPDLADKANEFAKYLFNSLHTVIAQEQDSILISPAHHGTIGLYHLKAPIDIKKGDLTKYNQLTFDETTFITYAVKSALKTKKPDSYETIAKINAGILDLKDYNVADLETGPNRCALG